MKRLLLIMSALVVLLSLNVCSAMVISQPVKIGELTGVNMDGFIFKQKLSNNGDVRHIRQSGMHVYGKGTATFGTNAKKLYLHYKTYGYDYNTSPQISRYGGSSPENAIQISTLLNEIYVLNSNENITFYIVATDYFEYGCDNLILIGERQDGRFVKYLETDTILDQYYGTEYGSQKGTGIVYFIDYMHGKIQANGDTIIFPCKTYDYNDRKKEPVAVGEIRCKWDENAQWFAVENVVY